MKYYEQHETTYRFIHEQFWNRIERKSDYLYIPANRSESHFVSQPNVQYSALGGKWNSKLYTIKFTI